MHRCNSCPICQPQPTKHLSPPTARSNPLVRHKRRRAKEEESRRKAGEEKKEEEKKAGEEKKEDDQRINFRIEYRPKTRQELQEERIRARVQQYFQAKEEASLEGRSETTKEAERVSHWIQDEAVRHVEEYNRVVTEMCYDTGGWACCAFPEVYRSAQLYRPVSGGYNSELRADVDPQSSLPLCSQTSRSSLSTITSQTTIKASSRFFFSKSKMKSPPQWKSDAAEKCDSTTASSSNKTEPSSRLESPLKDGGFRESRFIGPPQHASLLRVRAVSGPNGWIGVEARIKQLRHLWRDRQGREEDRREE